MRRPGDYLMSSDQKDPPIRVLRLSRRPYNYLRRAGIDTVGQLALLSDEQFLGFRELGTQSFAEIKRKLQVYLARYPLRTEALCFVDGTASRSPEQVTSVWRHKPEPGGTALKALGLSVRPRNALMRSGIKTVDQLAAMDVGTAKRYLEDETCQHPQLVVAVPKKKMQFVEAFLEIEAANTLRRQGLVTEGGSVDPEDLDAISKDAQSIVTKGLADFLRADNFIWYCGANVTTMKRGEEESYISQLLEQVLPKTPAVRDIAIMEPLSSTSTKGQKDRREAMAVLLEVKGAFPIKKLGGGALDRILRACLRDTELLEKVSDKGPIEEFQVRKASPPGSQLSEIWQLLRRTVIDERGKAVEMGKLVRTLLAPPYGLSHQLIEILLATFLRDIKDECVIFGNHLTVMKTRNADYYSLVPITAENLARLVRYPDDFVVYYYEVTDVERKYVTAIMTKVDTKGEFTSDIGLWENGKNCLLSWFGTLPRTTRSAADFQHPESKALIELLSDKNRVQSAKELFQQYLPEALRVEVSAPLLQSDCEKLIAAFTACYEELANFAQSQGLLLLSRLADMFEAKGKLLDDVSIAVGKWYNETLTELQRLHAFPGDEGCLKRAVEEDGSIVERFLVHLPVGMGLGPYTDWEDARNLEDFVARVEVAKQNIEQWLQGKTVDRPGGDLGERMARALAQIRSVFQRLNIPSEKQKEILARLLEEISE